MLIIIIVVVGLSILILGHEAAHFFAAKAFGLKVDEFGFGFPPRITAKKIGETEYSINWLPFGGFVKISGERGEILGNQESGMKNQESRIINKKDTQNPNNDSGLFFKQPAWKKSLIVLAGVFINFIIGWFLLSAVLMVGTPQTLVITAVQPGSPAQQVGFMAGDVIKDYKSSTDFINFVDAHEGEPITVAVLRNDKEFDFSVTPRVNPAPGQGAIGVELEDGGSARENPLAALRDGFMSSVILLGLTFGAFWQLIVQLFTKGSLLPGVVGPVGIVGVAEETGKIGLAYLIQFLGIISINLAVVNCIPFPALDGGRFLMVVIEKIKGSAVPEKFEAWVNGLGFAFLIVLMVLLTVRDIKGLV